MSAASRAGPKMCRALWAWARLRNWRWRALKMGPWSGWPGCATGWRAGILEIAGNGREWRGAPRAANTTNIWFDRLEGEALVIALDLKGVAVCGGSACHSGSTEPSHVLMAMGLDKNAARASLRFSLLKTATEEDVDYVLEVVPEAVERLRALVAGRGGNAG